VLEKKTAEKKNKKQQQKNASSHFAFSFFIPFPLSLPCFIASTNAWIPLGRPTPFFPT